MRIGFSGQRHSIVLTKAPAVGALVAALATILALSCSAASARPLVPASSVLGPGLNWTLTSSRLSPPVAVDTAAIRVYRYPTVFQGLSIQPQSVTMAADGNNTVTGLQWRDWGASTTRATGTNHFNDCRPSCANGDVARVPATLTLYSPGDYKGHYVYECYALTPARGQAFRICLP